MTGCITFDGEEIAGPSGMVPPHKRGIGLVAQEGALFPHLSVGGNIGFGMDVGVPIAGRSMSCCGPWSSIRRSASACRMSCRAASSSAWRWRGRWRGGRS